MDITDTNIPFEIRFPEMGKQLILYSKLYRQGKVKSLLLNPRKVMSIDIGVNDRMSCNKKYKKAFCYKLLNGVN